MFLFSAISTSACKTYLGLDQTAAAFIGSGISGYLTGALASPREWKKVLRNQIGSTIANDSAGAVIAGLRSGHLSSVFRRINAAGIRSGMFDSIFFGVRAALPQDGTLLSPPVVYAVSAISAASADYLVDVAVKRMMRVPPNYHVPGILYLLKDMIKSERIFDLHRGLTSKAAEMGISYAVTGFFSIYITQLFYKYFSDQ